MRSNPAVTATTQTDPVQPVSYKQLEAQQLNSLVDTEPPRYQNVAMLDDPTYDKLDTVPLTLATVPLPASTGEYDKLDTVTRDEEKIDLGSLK